MKPLHRIISEIVDSIRKTGVITAINDNLDGTYTYVSANDLKPLQSVIIDGLTYLVKAATPSDFTLTSNIPAATTWQAAHPYFMHEKELKAFNVLTEMSGKTNLKYQKYPLVLLIHPYTEKKVKYADYVADFRIAIVNHTDNNWQSEERYSNNFDDILTPIYEGLINGMCANVNISRSNPRKIEHDKTDNLYIDGNKMPDKLDGIIIDFKNIPIINSNSCDVEAEIHTTFDVTTTIEGEGVINSNPTTLTGIKKGTLVSLNACPNSGSDFEKWVINGKDYLNQIYSTIIGQNINAVAHFMGGLVTKLKTFHSAPVARGNAYYMPDYAQANDVLIKNTPIGVPDGVNVYGTFNQRFAWLEYTRNPWTIELDMIIKNNAESQKTIFGSNRYTTYPQFHIGFGNGGTFYISAAFASTNKMAKSIYTNINGNYKFRVTYNGSKLLSGLNIYKDGNLAAAFTALFDTLTSDTITNANPFSVFGNIDANSKSINQIRTLKIWSSVQPPSSTVAPDLANFIFNQGDGAIIPCQTTDNYITLNGAVLDTFWAGRDDVIEPTPMTKGATLYRNNTTNKIKAISKDISVVYSGFTRIGYFPAGSGILKGLPNKYNITGCAPTIPDGDYTADQIAAFTPSQNLVLEQNANAVTSLTVKTPA